MKIKDSFINLEEMIKNFSNISCLFSLWFIRKRGGNLRKDPFLDTNQKYKQTEKVNFLCQILCKIKYIEMKDLSKVWYFQKEIFLRIEQGKDFCVCTTGWLSYTNCQ